MTHRKSVFGLSLVISLVVLLLPNRVELVLAFGVLLTAEELLLRIPFCLLALLTVAHLAQVPLLILGGLASA